MDNHLNGVNRQILNNAKKVPKDTANARKRHESVDQAASESVMYGRLS